MKFQKYIIVFLLLSIILAGALLRFDLLESYPMDRDELARVVPEFSLRSFVSPGFLLLIKFSGALFEYSDLGYRFPVLIFSVLAIAAIYFLGKTLFEEKAGILSAFIFSCLFVVIVYTNQAKEYIPMMFFVMPLSIIGYKIFFNDGEKKTLYLAYILTALLSLLFASYFFILVIFYQAVIFVLAKLFTDFQGSITFVRRYLRFKNHPLLLLLTEILLLVGLAFLLEKARNFFGVYLIKPTILSLQSYFQGMVYFITQDDNHGKFLNAFFILGLVSSLIIPKFRKGYFYISLFWLLDALAVVSIRFSNLSFPFGYPRYHTFILPLYITGVSASTVGLVSILTKIIDKVSKKFRIINFFKPLIEKTKLIEISVMLLFIIGNLKFMIPLIKWNHMVPSSVLLTNYKDAGEYLNFHMSQGDTLVRVKMPGVADKYNPVNRYIDKKILSSKINYSIFPERMSKTNWYVPIISGDEDTVDFPGWLKADRIRPTFRFNAPYIYKLDYYGPLIRSRQVMNDGVWKATASISSETAKLAIDGDLKTTWESPMKTGDFFTVDMGKEDIINGINYNFTSNAFPQTFLLFTSLDNVNWQSVFTSAIPGMHPHNFSQIYIKPTKARFIKLEFVMDPLALIDSVSIKDITVNEVYKKNYNIDEENIFIADPVKKYNFSNSFEGWMNNEGILNMNINNGILEGESSKTDKIFNLRSPDEDEFENKSVNYINFGLSVDKGNYALVLLRTQDGDFQLGPVPLDTDGLEHYYSVNLNDYNIPATARKKIKTVFFYPTNLAGAKFGLDFFSLDRENLPGIQVKDKESPNGLTEFVPYEPNDDFNIFQIGNKIKPDKGRYSAKFKIKVDSVNSSWKNSLKSYPDKLYGYIDPMGTSTSDILYVSAESTRGTFFGLPGYLIIKGETFQQAGKYYEFFITFETDGKETISFQGFSPKDRRYPANLYITYPEIERVK